jgi:hypothetical protein
MRESALKTLNLPPVLDNISHDTGTWKQLTESSLWEGDCVSRGKNISSLSKFPKQGSFRLVTVLLLCLSSYGFISDILRSARSINQLINPSQNIWAWRWQLQRFAETPEIFNVRRGLVATSEKKHVLIIISHWLQSVWSVHGEMLKLITEYISSLMPHLEFRAKSRHITFLFIRHIFPR